MKRTTAILALMALNLGICGTVTYAASFSGGTWGGNDTTLALNSTSFPSGNTYNLHAQYAMSDWNAVIGSNFIYSVKSSNCDPGVHLPSSDNCVAFVSSSVISGALGLTNWVRIGGTLYDADVRFNADVSWIAGLNIDDFSYGPPFAFQGVARHEFGHALGLCHEDRSGNVVLMNSVFSAGAVKPANPHWDERLGLRALYPSGGSERDLIAYMWKKTTNDVQGCNSSSSSTVSVPVNPVTSTVPAGNTVTLEYSLENAGNLSSGSFAIGFYMSGNTTISTGDTLIGSNSGATAGAHSRGTFTRILTIPSNAPPGVWYLGVCLDYLGSVSETLEGNNCAQAPGKVTVNVPDLIVKSEFVSDSSLYLNQIFNAYATVRNQGSASSTPTTLRYYRSTNSTISTSDTQIGTDLIYDLPPDGSSAHDASVISDSPGTFWIGACIDSVTSEFNTSNNCSTGIQVTVSQAACPDAFELDIHSGIAKTITSGIPKTHSICPVGDDDWSTFTLTAESAVTLQTSGPSGDTRMWLRDAAGAQIEVNDDFGADRFSLIDRTCGVDALPAGTYFVEVDEFADDQEIPYYTLAFTATPCPCTPDGFEPDGSSGLAKTITSGIPKTHSICPVGDDDWSTFTLTAESAVTLQTSGPSGDTRMWLRDAAGAQIELNDDFGADRFSLIDRTCGVDALPAGTYFVEVDEFANDQEIANYALALGAVPCGCPVNLVLANQTLSGTQTLEGASTATLGPNLIIDGTDIVVNAPTVTILGNTLIKKNFTVGNTTSCN